MDLEEEKHKLDVTKQKYLREQTEEPNSLVREGHEMTRKSQNCGFLVACVVASAGLAGVVAPKLIHRSHDGIDTEGWTIAPQYRNILGYVDAEYQVDQRPRSTSVPLVSL